MRHRLPARPRISSYVQTAGERRTPTALGSNRRTPLEEVARHWMQGHRRLGETGMASPYAVGPRHLGFASISARLIKVSSEPGVAGSYTDSLLRLGCCEDNYGDVFEFGVAFQVCQELATLQFGEVEVEQNEVKMTCIIVWGCAAQHCRCFYSIGCYR